MPGLCSLCRAQIGSSVPLMRLTSCCLFDPQKSLHGATEARCSSCPECCQRVSRRGFDRRRPAVLLKCGKHSLTSGPLREGGYPKAHVSPTPVLAYEVQPDKP